MFSNEMITFSNMKYYTSFSALIFLCLFCFEMQSQSRPEQDCVGAIRICDNVNFTVPVTYNGGGNVRDIPNNTICLTNEENNSVWFYFDVDSGGIVVFTINPLQPDDYDFAVYNTHNCSEIHNAVTLAVRCSYASYIGATGLAVGYTDTTAGVPDTAFLAPLEVQAGERYYLIVDNFGTGGAGFSLDFSGTTAKFKVDSNANFSYYDSFLGYSSIAPGNIRLAFSGYFDCEATIVDPDYYSITGPSNIQIDSVAVDCTTGNDSLMLIDIFYSGVFIDNGNYSFVIDGGVSLSNLCNSVTFANGNGFDFTSDVEAVDIIAFELDSFNLANGNKCYSYDILFSPPSSQTFIYSEDEFILNESNNYLCFTSYGTKEVCAVAFNNFSADTICKTINVISSISEKDLLKLFSVYPNPATSKIFVETLGNEKIQQVMVYDILGKTVNAPVQKSEANNFIINTETLTSGLYYIHILTEKNEVAVKKVAVYRQ